jgi:aminoglycoside 3-N-acetyltransferase
MKLDTDLFLDVGKIYRSYELRDALDKLSINKGDVILVRSALFSFGVPAVKTRQAICSPCFLGEILDCFLDAVGTGGTVLMPTYTYSFCKGLDFDVKRTPSTTGLFTEYFRNLPGIKRTLEPIFSMSIYGREADYFSDISNLCFGEGSIYDKLYTSGAKLVGLGVPSAEALTPIHYIEKKANVPYRFDKNFSGTIINHSDNKIPSEVVYFVRKLDEPSIGKIYRIEEIVKANFNFKEISFAKGIISSFDYPSFVDNYLQKLRINPYYFVE